MTDIELLPLPEADDSVENRAQWPIVIDSDVWLQKSVQDYARANVEHYVKELQEEVVRVRGLWGDAEILCHKLHDQNAAKDAEIERLRAEVCQEQDYAASAARRVLMAQLAQRRAEARAERLAEALRLARNRIQRLVLECPYGSAIRYDACEWADEASAALRDHDQQGDSQ